MADLLMPKFGLTMTEGTVTEWHVKPGQAFAAGDLLFTVETEKVANEVEAETDGVLGEILVAEGETAPVGVPIARLGGGGSDAPPAPAPEVEAAPSPKVEAPVVEAKATCGRVIATPLARRLAKQAGVDLGQISGSGPRGRIKAADVKAAAKAAPAPAAPPPASDGVTEIVPDAARLATARMVSASKRDVPHFYVASEAEVSGLMDLRAELNAEPGRPRISVTHMLIRALGLALVEMPEANRIWAGERILQFEQAHVGMLTETPAGLRIPVLRNVAALALDDVAAAATGLAERARAGDLKPADVGDGVISISNVGMFGVARVTPIINPPSAMILGVGAERQVFRPDAAGAPDLKREISLTLACDHRVIDGADAARLLAATVAILETPMRLLRPARAA